MTSLDDPAIASPSRAPSQTRHVAVLGHFAQGPSYSVQRARGAGSWLLTWTIGGSGSITQGSTTIVTQAGDVVVLGPGIPQRYGTAGPCWDFWWSHFRPRAAWLVTMEAWHAGDGLYRTSVTAHADRVRVAAAFARARDDIAPVGAGTPADGTILVSAVTTTDLVLNAIEEILLVAGRASRSGVDSPDAGGSAVDAAARTITADPAAHHTVASLAAASAMSPSHFAHEFRRRTGRTPMAAVRAERLDLAAGLLRSSDLSIGQVARAVGFEDPYYFSRVFRRHVGVSPSTYRTSTRRQPPAIRPEIRSS